MKIKQTYLIFIIVIGLVSLSVYSTYALFAATTEIDNVVNINTSLSLESSILEYEMVTVPAGETKIIELNVSNISSNTLYYGAWYQMVNPTSLTDDIELGLYTEKNSTPGSGTITGNTTLNLLVGITNDSSREIIINVGVVGSVDNNLNLSDNKVLFPSGWADAILVTDEYLAEHSTTTTETVTTTNPVNLSYSYSGSAKNVTLKPGTYKLEVWGAQGGSYDSTYIGGKGGYSYGTLTLTENTTVYVYVGGQGANGTSSGTYAGGFNGGGQAYSSSTTYAMSGGGGATDIRIGQDSLYARVIVAGGGGGAGNYNSSYRYSGGAGGGLSGVAGGSYNSSYPAGGAGSATSAGISYYGSANTDSTAYGTPASFGNGGAGASGYLRYIAGGGGGWYGGGYARRASGGGGSGYVYTSSTASQCPSGCLLNSSYYLTNADTKAGTLSFTDFDGSTVTGHLGNGAAKITGTEQVTTQGEKTVYTIPRVLGIGSLTINPGASHNLTSGVTVECAHGKTGCSLVGTSINDTSTLEVGEYTVYYTVKSSEGKKYKYPRKIFIVKDLTISNILVNNSTHQGIPQTGLYTLSSNCSNISYDSFTKKVKITDFSTAMYCQLNFTSSTNYPKLNTMQVGDYVAYVGDPANGCLNGATGTTGKGAAESGNSCKGYNANQPTDGTEDANGSYGYCYNSSYNYTTYGWRIAYIEDNKVHLISAGSPECRTRTSSTNNATAITDLNTAALDYCNSTYVDGGVCPTTASESNAVRALGNTDFEKITYAISGTTSSLTSVYGSTICYNQYSYKRCGYGNDLLDNGGLYRFAAHNNSTEGVAWSPSGRYVNVSSSTIASGFRPIIRLSSSVYVTGGSGTMTDPYTIGI